MGAPPSNLRGCSKQNAGFFVRRGADLGQRNGPLRRRQSGKGQRRTPRCATGPRCLGHAEYQFPPPKYHDALRDALGYRLLCRCRRGGGSACVWPIWGTFRRHLRLGLHRSLRCRNSDGSKWRSCEGDKRACVSCRGLFCISWLPDQRRWTDVASLHLEDRTSHRGADLRHQLLERIRLFVEAALEVSIEPGFGAGPM
jgi:hypothetical protein